MKPSSVIDTNVMAAASGLAVQAGPQCIDACVAALAEVRDRNLILIDDAMRMLDEYRARLSLSGQPGPGDRFFKWLWQNQANPEHCLQVAIHARDEAAQEFAEFPVDPQLKAFDPADRKFVAVALGSKLDPEVLNATDTDWWLHRVALEQNGIRLRFLCPELMKGAGMEPSPRKPAH